MLTCFRLVCWFSCLCNNLGGQHRHACENCHRNEVKNKFQLLELLSNIVPHRDENKLWTIFLNFLNCCLYGSKQIESNSLTFVSVMEVKAPYQAIEERGHHENGCADVEHYLVMQVVENYWLKHFPWSISLKFHFRPNYLSLTKSLFYWIYRLKG